MGSLQRQCIHFLSDSLANFSFFLCEEHSELCRMVHGFSAVSHFCDTIRLAMIIICE